MLHWFQVYSEAILLYIYVYIYIFIFRLFFLVDYYKILSIVPCTVQ